MVAAVWPPISRTDLKFAGDENAFDSILPILIRLLIAETAHGLTELEMPGESGVSIGGFDGLVTASGASVKVPVGRSVWELSTEKSVNSKADRDYEKRTAGPNGEDPRNFTYVQVSVRTWRDASKWASDRAAEGRWKAVRAINLDGIREWLDQAPGTAVWLANQLGKPVEGAQSVSDWFENNWLPSTKIPLGPEVVLAGRAASADRFRELLQTQKTRIVVAGDATSTHFGVGTLTDVEFTAFVAASILEADQVQRDAWLSRALIVDERANLSLLLALPGPMLLLMADANLATRVPARAPHRLILLAPPGEKADVDVGRVDPSAVANTLEAGGLQRGEARERGILARRSLPALRRKLAKIPAAMHPSWARQPDAVTRRVLMLGGWDGANEHDRNLVATTLGREYSEIEDLAAGLAVAEIPALGGFEDRWYTLSAEDMWLLIRPHIKSEDLKILAGAFETVFADPDPFLSMDAYERVTNQLRGVRRRYSDTLRQGLAQVLTSSAIQPPSGRADFARSLVGKLLGVANADESYQRWGGLADVLELLAEAAPEEFLAAMRQGLRDRGPLHIRMFDQAGPNAMLGSNPIYPAFMHSLELLAWLPEYFDEAVDVLFELDGIDPGDGHYANRPERSLLEIFSCLGPDTHVDLARRTQALRRFAGKRPDRAFELMLALLEENSGRRFGHSKPRFRGIEPPTQIGPDDFRANVSRVGVLLLGLLAGDLDRHVALAGKVDRLLPEQRRSLEQRLIEFASHADDVGRSRIWMALRGVIARHRDFSQAIWALPEEELQLLEATLQALAPTRNVAGNAWLFMSGLISLGDGTDRRDHHAFDAELTHRRMVAVQETLERGGLPAVLDFAKTIDRPDLIGQALAAIASEHDRLDEELLNWSTELEPQATVARSFLRPRLIHGGLELLDHLLRVAHDPEQKVAILLASGLSADTRARLESLPPEVRRSFWQQFNGAGVTDGDNQYIVRGLATAGRHAAALDLISLLHAEFSSAEAADLVATICEAMIASGQPDPELSRVSPYAFAHLFDLIYQHRESIGEGRVLALEWLFYPRIGYEGSAPSIHRAMSLHPEIFIDVMQAVIDKSSGPSRPRRAFEILSSWKVCPGFVETGRFDSGVMREWVRETQRKLRELDLSDLGEEQIGQILAYAPTAEDGLTPAVAIRDMLEEFGSDHLDLGMGIGIFNKLHSDTDTFESPDSRVLADKFRAAAETVGNWSRVRRILLGLAKDHERLAEQDERREERYRRGIDG